MIAKLLDKQEPQQINTLTDLRRMKNYNIIVKKNSFAEDQFIKSESMQDLKHRVVLENFEPSSPQLLQAVINKVLKHQFVLVDDKNNFLNYLTSFPTNIFHIEDFFISNAIERLPGAWVFPKGKEFQTLRENITLKLQYLVDLGLYKYYSDSIANELFHHHGQVVVKHSEQLEV